MLGSLAMRSLFLVVAVAVASLFGAAGDEGMRLWVMPRDMVEARLKKFSRKNADREASLKKMFLESGCSPDNLSEVPVKGLKEPNVVCKLPGQTEATLLVGAHFDHVDAGDGVVDNWSGASLLPSLLEGMRQIGPLKHTIVFVGFAGEERGMVGSKAFARALTDEEAARVQAMVNLDTLGLGPSEVWASESDKRLVDALFLVAEGLKTNLRVMNVDGVGRSDEESFLPRHIPVIVVHSLTQETLRVLHSDRDTISAVKMDDYIASYHLLAAYLAYLDQKLPFPVATEKRKGAQ